MRLWAQEEKQMRKNAKTITINNSFDFRVADVYKAARKNQRTAQRKTFFVDDFAVSPSEWASAKMDGLDTAVSNASVKGNITRLVHKRGFNRKGCSYLKGKNYTIKPIDDVEEVVVLDEVLEAVPELV